MPLPFRRRMSQPSRDGCRLFIYLREKFNWGRWRSVYCYVREILWTLIVSLDFVGLLTRPQKKGRMLNMAQLLVQQEMGPGSTEGSCNNGTITERLQTKRKMILAFWEDGRCVWLQRLLLHTKLKLPKLPPILFTPTLLGRLINSGSEFWLKYWNCLSEKSYILTEGFDLICPHPNTLWNVVILNHMEQSFRDVFLNAQTFNIGIDMQNSKRHHRPSSHTDRKIISCSRVTVYTEN